MRKRIFIFAAIFTIAVAATSVNAQSAGFAVGTKLDDFKLSEEPVPITGVVALCNHITPCMQPLAGDYSVTTRPNIPAFVRVDHSAFQQHTHSVHPVRGAAPTATHAPTRNLTGACGHQRHPAQLQHMGGLQASRPQGNHAAGMHYVNLRLQATHVHARLQQISGRWRRVMRRWHAHSRCAAWCS